MRNTIDTFGAKLGVALAFAGQVAAIALLRRHVCYTLPMDGEDFYLILLMVIGGVFTIVLFFTFPSIGKLNKLIKEYTDLQNTAINRATRAVNFLDFMQSRAAKKFGVDRRQLMKEWNEWNRETGK